ncbi:MAG: hypothetical protein LBC53_01825, partial [Spirochaetaceae bacterium]|nr:hypothetical protein [Spirochaetaceae bacterium]
KKFYQILLTIKFAGKSIIWYAKTGNPGKRRMTQRITGLFTPPLPLVAPEVPFDQVGYDPASHYTRILPGPGRASRRKRCYAKRLFGLQNAANNLSVMCNFLE